jgi:hypothetical protein
MLDLLIAILIALGFTVEGTTKEEIQARYSKELDKAKEIMETGAYRETEGGGVTIIDVAGD